MTCLRCGWCCENLSPFKYTENYGLSDDGCIYLEYKNYVAICTIYRIRPDECKNHKFPADVCPIGEKELKK